ncbi:hypothetical protein [Gemmatimonas sp.]|uniref:hypothetical protein n=1 Tax=Gemmatimonas sp. TaxID=1962908 RepID=UPI003F6E6627
MNPADIEWRSFVVDEKPYCMWGIDTTSQNIRFLDGVDASYFYYVASSQIPNLNGPDRHRAALTIRTTYAHALETFFALLIAAVQAPHCPLGWILRYSPGDLARMVGKINRGDHLLAITKFDGTWLGLATAINAFELAEHQDNSRAKAQFADLWSYLASDLLDSAAITEYNSVKHGLRASSGGSVTSIGSPGLGVQAFLRSESEFGAHHFAAHKLRDNAINFDVRDIIRNWCPHALAMRTQLVCLSIGNVVSYLRVFLGAAPDDITFQCLDATYSVSAPWTNLPEVRSVVATQNVRVVNEQLLTRPAFS